MSRGRVCGHASAADQETDRLGPGVKVSRERAEDIVSGSKPKLELALFPARKPLANTEIISELRAVFYIDDVIRRGDVTICEPNPPRVRETAGMVEKDQRVDKTESQIDVENICDRKQRIILR